MLKKILTFQLFLIISSTVAQDIIVKPEDVKYPMDSITKMNFNQTLESFFKDIGQGTVNPDYLTAKRSALTTSILEEIVSYETSKDSTTVKIQDKQLINIIPVSDDAYSFSIIYTNQNENSLPTILYILNLIATDTNGKITFSIPIDYETRYWKTEEIGNVTYHFRDKINKERAEAFNEKNTKIASKLGLEPENLDLYMCDNYQEFLSLMGMSYFSKVNGQYRDGYGVDAKTIFSVMNNEDFSHDMFHYYSGQIHERKNRNWITEEGIAYSWGNAYYTDKDGEMISHKRLIDELKVYLSKNPNTELFELFSNNVKIYDHIAPEISVRSTISGLIANEIEKQKGMEGIFKLINAGSQDRLKNYLKATNELIGINQKNFNSKVGKLIKDYK